MSSRSLHASVITSTVIGWVCLLVLLYLPNQVKAEEFLISQADIQSKDAYYSLDADINFRFSETALEALRNGVPLTIELRAEILQRNTLIWNTTSASVVLRYQLRYHALARLYQIIELENNVQRNYASMSAALRALGQLRDLRLIEIERLDLSSSHIGRIKVILDIEALPLPLRPVAYLSPEWHLSSEWYRWDLEF